MASLTRNPGPGAPPSAPSTAAAPAVPQAPAPIVAPASVPMRRRRPGVIAAAIGLTALGGLVSAALYIQTGHRVAVLAVAVPLAEGQLITAQDLVTADVSLDPAVASIPASQESSVVQLAPGALLARGDVTNTPLQPAGTSVVGVQLKPGQLPAGRLSVGEQVELVYTPSSAQSALSTGSASSTQLPTTVQATIVNVGAVDTQGNETVDVAVTATLAPGLAAQAATGDIALIAVSAGGN